MPSHPVIAGAAACVLVGSSFAVSEQLTDFPVATGQALRYAAAALVLGAIYGAPGRPTRRDLGLLLGVAAAGCAGFNACVILAVDRMDPSAVGVVVGCAPLVLAIAGALAAGRRPHRGIVAGALVVVAGTALVEGVGAASLVGLLLAAGALAGECLFTLLAAPVISRMGAPAAATWACALAALLSAVAAVPVHGAAALALPSTGEALALAHLTLGLTVGAFVLWFRAVGALEVDRAGLLVGVTPVAALLTAVALGAEPLTALKLAGVLLTAAGVAGALRVAAPPRPAIA